LLVGEGARSSTLERICEIVQKDPAVERAGYPLTMYFGPETSCCLDIQFRPTITAHEVTQAVDRLENRYAHSFPEFAYLHRGRIAEWIFQPPREQTDGNGS